MSAIYTAALVRALTTGLSLASADIRVMLVKSTYTFDAADEDLADIGSVDNGRSGALASKTTTAGVFDAADTSLTATDADACDKLIVFVHTGTDGTALLIACIDITEFTPSASQTVNIVWSSGDSKIFRLLASA